MPVCTCWVVQCALLSSCYITVSIVLICIVTLLLFQYILIKFLGTAGADAERMGVHCIRAHGYNLSQDDIKRVAFIDRLVCGGGPDTHKLMSVCRK